MQVIFEMIKEGQNPNSELSKLVVEPYIAEKGIKREEINLSDLAKWMEDKVKMKADNKGIIYNKEKSLHLLMIFFFYYKLSYKMNEKNLKLFVL
jgi:hypothetical protein